MSQPNSHLLVLKSNILVEYSQSSLLIDYALRELAPDTMTVRDLANPSLPVLDGAGAQVLRGGGELNYAVSVR